MSGIHFILRSSSNITVDVYELFPVPVHGVAEAVELLSRINALMRRTYGSMDKEKTVTFGDITVNITSRTVTRDNKPVNLSLREFDLLAYLCEHKNEAISKNKLINEVWGAFSMVEPSTLTVHIRWLREKLEQDPASPVYIKTVWGVGYILEANDEK